MENLAITQATAALDQSRATQAAQGAKNLRHSGKTDVEAMRRAAQEFEAVYLSQMLQPMFANLGAEEPFGGGMGEDMWRSMQVEEYGKSIAKAGGIGIADVVFKEMLKMQEVQ